ncbi:hypothetical protein QQ020_06145 [Fulvivirgaceae bacterium BMA12]|uniref:site-specific DNA-methyltransferase (cytosine-N(4)-specific) n=1 Tax=Agaribacillus aureus TaxID=3051825 RepID=A0ABT8L1R4_9BACT|nr:hypothetical protein [Fulvivirgaceae bacterium BMA12]
MELIKKVRPIHPFAARMAPEIAFEALNGVPKGAVILDPMVGSGTVLRTVSDYGYHGIGFDVDPLAVLMSKAWTSPIKPESLLLRAKQLVKETSELQQTDISLLWVDRDKDTREFINFWFAKPQIRSLRKLSYLLAGMKGPYSNVLRIALSRLIITKTKGASLAADVSHSRPHRVRTENDFDVNYEFLRACQRLAKLIEANQPSGNVNIRLGDARKLKGVKDNTVDAIITSPPYLNALDYMRGHKLALVWLGHKIGELASIRSGSVGVERAPSGRANLELAKKITAGMDCMDKVPPRTRNMIYRYALDIHAILEECARVLKNDGRATFVVGNSCLRGVYIENTHIVSTATRMFGLQLIGEREREIPETKRYLPPPTNKEASAFKSRMRTESVLTYCKA